VTSLEVALRHVHADLTEAGVAFALVGGLAVSVRTEPRFTRDADVAVAPESDREAEALISPYQIRRIRRSRAESAFAGRLRRPQDLVDLPGLLRIASDPDLALARESLVLIAARGCHRGRDLEAEMNRLFPREQ
jgi:hypothetical protein